MLRVIKRLITAALWGVLAGLAAGGVAGGIAGTVAAPIAGTVIGGALGAIMGLIGGPIAAVAMLPFVPAATKRFPRWGMSVLGGTVTLVGLIVLEAVTSEPWLALAPGAVAAGVWGGPLVGAELERARFEQQPPAQQPKLIGWEFLLMIAAGIVSGGLFATGGSL